MATQLDDVKASIEKIEDQLGGEGGIRERLTRIETQLGARTFTFAFDLGSAPAQAAGKLLLLLLVGGGMGASGRELLTTLLQAAAGAPATAQVTTP